MSDFRVPIRTELEPSTYRYLAGYAALRHKDVGQILAELADHAVRQFVEAGAPQPEKPNARPRFTPAEDQAIRELYAQGMNDSEIARRLKRHYSGVARRRKRMGLTATYNRTKKASA